MRRWTRILAVALCAIGLTFSAREAQALKCPCVRGPYPKPAVVKHAWFDKKGGVWGLICTNQSATGDFVWVYVPAGGGMKVIGRCIFVGGQNGEGVVRGPDGNVAYWWHYCIDGGDDDGEPWDAIIDIFCKEDCRWMQLCMNWNGSNWVETGRRFKNMADFQALPLFDGNYDSIPDAGFAELTAGLYPPPPPPLPAEFASKVELRGHWDLNTGTRIVRAHPGATQPPMIGPGDFIEIEIVSLSLVSVNPIFTVQPMTGSTRLVPNAPILLTEGFEICRVNPSGLGKTKYGIDDQGAFNFYHQLFLQHPAVPIHMLPGGFSNVLNMSNMPGYAATMGEMELGANPIPTVSEWGMIAMGLLLLSGGTLVIRSRSASFTRVRAA